MSEPQEHVERRYTVAETAAKCGISTSALTRYVKRGLIPPPRPEGGKRTYGAETIAEIPRIRAELRKARLDKLAKAPTLPIPDGRLTVKETAKQAEISVATLGNLKSAGLIPQPERYGRSLTYGTELVPIIKAIMEQRGVATSKKRSHRMTEIWRDQEYRDLITFTTSKPKKRTKPQSFSPEFLAHQGQLKNSKVQSAAREGQQRFLRNEQKYDAWIESLTIAQNRTDIKQRKSAAMQCRMAEKKARLDRSHRPATKAAIFAEAHKRHEAGESWSTIARRLFPSEYRVDPEHTVDSLKKGVRYYAKPKGANHHAQTQARS